MTRAVQGAPAPLPLCGKGTRNGEAAAESKYGFAPCTLPADHRPPCDSGPVEGAP